MSKRRHRHRSGYYLWAETEHHGFQKVRRITFDEGELGVERRQLVHLRSNDGKLIGFVTKGIKRAPVQPSNRFDPTSITAAEAQANAGLRGRSRTAALSEEARQVRVHHKTGKSLPPEDFVERTRNKIAAFPQTANFRTGDKAVRVYPRASQSC